MPDSLAAHLAAHGVHARRLRPLVALLCRGWQPLDALVRDTAVPRRTVEDLLTACGDDVERDGPRWRVKPERAPEYRRLAEPPPAPDDEALRAALADYLAGVPKPRRALDHVQADLDTMLRRARWLDGTYDLVGAHLLCVGDHDLTALAACTTRPGLTATVVDVDEDLLAYVDATARARGLPVRCLHADFRLGLPPGATGCADLVFTDPPYTPEGMRLFLARGVQALRGPDGRLLAAYGHSDRAPALGWKTQREILGLGLVMEAVLPGFNRYLGAQAVGSAAALYVLHPTSRARDSAEAATKDQAATIYTHGPQSLESGAPDGSARAALLELSGADRVLGPGWAEPTRLSGPLAHDLSADPGAWLVRTLLAAPRRPVWALVPNNHPDIADQRGQQAIQSLLAAKYRLAFRRSVPDGAHAVVVATPTPAEGVVAALLDRVHGKLGNVWREALIRARGDLTKREARDLVAELAPDPADLTERLIDLPRHRIAEILTAAGGGA